MLILYCGNASDGEECRCHGVIDFEGSESRIVSQGEANWRFCPPMTRVTLDSRIDTQPTSNPGAAGLINTNFIRVDSRARPW